MTAIATTTNTHTLDDAPATRVPVRSLLRVNALAATAAAAATETLTAVARASGIHLEVGDPGGRADSVVPVNAGACAITIAMCTVIGTALAVHINRRSSRPARTYRIATGVLVLLSLPAPLTAAGTSTATKATLIAAHLIAAAIIVPVVSRRLAR